MFITVFFDSPWLWVLVNFSLLPLVIVVPPLPSLYIIEAVTASQLLLPAISLTF